MKRLLRCLFPRLVSTQVTSLDEPCEQPRAPESPGVADGVAGTLVVTGDYTQSASGRLKIDIGGATPGTQFDQLITGTEALTKLSALGGALFCFRCFRRGAQRADSKLPVPVGATQCPESSPQRLP